MPFWLSPSLHKYTMCPSGYLHPYIRVQCALLIISILICFSFLHHHHHQQQQLQFTFAIYISQTFTHYQCYHHHHHHHHHHYLKSLVYPTVISFLLVIKNLGYDMNKRSVWAAHIISWFSLSFFTCILLCLFVWSWLSSCTAKTMLRRLKMLVSILL